MKIVADKDEKFFIVSVDNALFKMTNLVNLAVTIWQYLFLLKRGESILLEFINIF